MGAPRRRIKAPQRAALSDPIREAVEAKGLTAAGIAEATGLDRRVVARWLSRQRDVLLSTADLIAQAAGVKAVDARRAATKPSRAAAGDDGGRDDA